MVEGMTMRKLAGATFALLGAAFLAIQLVPVDRTNPPVETEVPASDEVRAILHRACYDCHSNETRWPWHSRIAPVSWLVAKDVREGREELNFSTWNRLRPKDRAKALRKSWKEIEDGEMPPLRYFPPHPEARLSDDDRALLLQWTGGD